MFERGFLSSNLLTVREFGGTKTLRHGTETDIFEEIDLRSI
jgi:hypothetical protein